MASKLDLFFSLLTSGKYTGIKDEKDMDAVIRLIVLNITYLIASVLIIVIGVSNMRNDMVDKGLLELIIGFLMFLNIFLLRTEIPFMVGGLIIIALFGCFCSLAFVSKNEVQFTSLWIYLYPLMSIFTLGLPVGLLPALLIFIFMILTFILNISVYSYTLAEAMTVCGVYFFVFVLTVIYEYVRSIKDHWLSRQDSYMNMVFQNSPDIILLLDKNGGLVYCANIFLQKTNITNFASIRKAHYTQVFSHFCEPDQLKEIVDLFEKSMKIKNPVVFERKMNIDKDSESRYYAIHFTPMYDENDAFQGAFILFHDMTEIVMVNKRMEHASNAKSNFLANMSHEIRTPLNAIIGMTTIAQNTTNSERKDYCLTRITGASNHLLKIINDILDMSKIEEGKLELSCMEFDFSSMIQQIANMFEFRFSEKKQQFIITTDPLIPKRIVTDEQRLTQVIANLIGNAVKFTPEEGKISLDAKLLERDDKKCILEIRVTDTGIGISKEQQSKLFRSFVQVDSSISKKFGGTGLGLAISKTIVEMMQGNIRIESELEQGTTFIFTAKVEVPKDADQTIDVLSEKSSSYEHKEGDFSGKRILLAEDIDINREIVITLLADLKVEIDEAEDGQQAFKKFVADPEKYDLIFMDIHMPNVDGYEAARLIRALEHQHAKNIPIIAMTANVFKEDIEKCLAAGMNGHLGKPLNFNEVTLVLNKYLGKK
ncbi:MAG: ATP-binding protein [Spirochaetaceae bacterium]|nr:ATP-binding protein [Spirochaetaceae bacterium]